MGRKILGIKVDNVTMAAAAEIIYQRCTDQAASPLHVITLNPEMVVTAQRQPRFATIINQAGLVAPDGVGIQWGVRQLGGPALERVPGIELAETVLARASAVTGRKLRVYLLGAKPDVVTAASEKVACRYSGITVCGAQHGYFPLQDSAQIVEQIKSTHADLVLVGLGSPRQEYWIAEHLTELECRVAIGVGGVFDVWSGSVVRAPVAMRRLGLEWLYRLAKQPSRLPRMMALPKFVLLIYKERLTRKG